MADPESSPTAPTARMHVVQSGETLAQLAQRYYGNANDSARILEANRHQLGESGEIREGMALVIPVPAG